LSKFEVTAGQNVAKEVGATSSERFLVVRYSYISRERSRDEMHSGHGRLCVCLSIAAFPHYRTDPDVT